MAPPPLRWWGSREVTGYRLKFKIFLRALRYHLKNFVRRFLDGLYLLIGLIPIVWMTLLVIAYFQVANEIGYWPKYNNPDYGQYNHLLIYDSNLNIFLMMSSLWGIIVVPCLISTHFIITRFCYKSLKIRWLNVLTGLAPYVLLWLFMATPPTSEIWNWYID